MSMRRARRSSSCRRPAAAAGPLTAAAFNDLTSRPHGQSAAADRPCEVRWMKPSTAADSAPHHHEDSSIAASSSSNTSSTSSSSQSAAARGVIRRDSVRVRWSIGNCCGRSRCLDGLTSCLEEDEEETERPDGSDDVVDVRVVGCDQVHVILSSSASESTSSAACSSLSSELSDGGNAGRLRRRKRRLEHSTPREDVMKRRPSIDHHPTRASCGSMQGENDDVIKIPAPAGPSSVLQLFRRLTSFRRRPGRGVGSGGGTDPGGGGSGGVAGRRAGPLTAVQAAAFLQRQPSCKSTP